jgi:mRNA-degrading endonuclease toxin of MazEF toxin-antitoxin module
MAGKLFDRCDIVHCLSPHAEGGDSRHFAVIVGDPVANTSGHYMLVQITSTAYNGRTDYRLLDSDPEFAQTGLDHSSTFRCHKVFVLADSRVRRKIGSAGPKTMLEIEARLKIALGMK